MELFCLLIFQINEEANLKKQRMEKLAGVVNQLTALSFAGYLHQAMEFVVQCNGSLFLYLTCRKKKTRKQTSSNTSTHGSK